MTVGQKIKQLRVYKLGCSRGELETMIGKQNSKCVARWEHDKSQPCLKTYHKLLEVFDITDREFMKGVEL